ncbi:MAG: hypothetical protein V4857_17715, partial [Pseudomonadota bacterium]
TTRLSLALPRLREDDVGLSYPGLVISRFRLYRSAQFAFCDSRLREDDVDLIFGSRLWWRHSQPAPLNIPAPACHAKLHSVAREARFVAKRLRRRARFRIFSVTHCDPLPPT